MDTAPGFSANHHAATDKITISIVIAMHNEENAIDILFQRLGDVLDPLPFRFKYVCVNDGSSDGTLARLKQFQRSDPRVRIIDLTRNFGKEAAMMAGLKYAPGEAAILIDADLQDPPELIPEFIGHWLKGYDVIYGYRTSRKSDSVVKRATAHLFYKFFNALTEQRITENAGDFRLLDRKVIDALLSLPERNLFLKGLYSWVGFRQIGIPFERQPRIAGATSWGYRKLTNYAIDALTGFSVVPLRIASIAGAVISILGISYALYLVLRTLIFGIDVPGYASLMVAILFLGGIQLLGLGVVGEYVGRLYVEAKKRPLYLVSDVFEEAHESEDHQPIRTQLSGAAPQQSDKS